MAVHQHHGADKVFKGEMPQANADMNITPMIDVRGRYFVGVTEVVPKDDLGRRVTESLETKSDKIVLIKADRGAEYGAVMQALDQLRAAGVEDMGLITGTPAPGREGGE